MTADLSPGRPRLLWVDLARGLAILLVILGHCVQGISNAGLADPDGPFGWLDTAVSAMRMPLFFLVSGVLFAQAAMTDPGRKLWQRIVGLLRPLVIWTYLFLVLRAAAGSLVNHPMPFAAILVPPLPPVDHMWFLWALLLQYLVFSYPKVWVVPLIGPRAFWAGAFAASVLVFVAVPVSEEMTPWFGPALEVGPYFALGGLVGSALPLAQLRVGARGAAVALAAALALLVVDLGRVADSPPHLALAGPLALCLVALCIWVGDVAGGSRLVRGVIALGGVSLALFVAHTIFSASTRIALEALGVRSVAVHLIFGMVAGVIGPLLLHRAATRLGIARAVGLA